MIKIVNTICSIAIAALIISGCGTISPTIASMPSFTPSPESTPTLTATFTPSPTPTSLPPLLMGTSIPTPDESILLENADRINELARWDEENPVLTAAISPDGELLATGSTDGKIRIYRLANGTLLNTLEMGNNEVWSIAFSPDGIFLTAGSKEGAIKYWRVNKWVLMGRVLDTSAKMGTIRSLSYSPDGKMLALATDGNWVVVLVSYAFNRVEKITQYPPGSAAFSPDGKTIVYGTRPAEAVIRKPFTTDPGFSIGLDNVTGAAPEKIRNFIEFVSFSPDGQTLAMMTLDGTIRLWKVADGTLLHEMKANSSSIAFSPDGQILASGSSDGTLELWGVADGTLMRTLNGHTKKVMSVTFSPNGEILASGSADGTVRLWGVK